MKNVTPGFAESRLMTAAELIAEIADPARRAGWELRVRLGMAAAEAAERLASSRRRTLPCRLRVISGGRA